MQKTIVLLKNLQYNARKGRIAKKRMPITRWMDSVTATMNAPLENLKD